MFGELAPGVYSACVQNGVGCARGTYQGELAADLVMGNDHELLRDMLAHARPTQLPPQPLTRWAASARIRGSNGCRAGKGDRRVPGSAPTARLLGAGFYVYASDHDQGFQPPLPYGRVMISRRWPLRSSK